MTPSFSGHSLFNMKDIPYALQFFLFSVYFSEYIQNHLNNNSKNMNFNFQIEFYVFIKLTDNVICLCLFRWDSGGQFQYLHLLLQVCNVFPNLKC